MAILRALLFTAVMSVGALAVPVAENTINIEARAAGRWDAHAKYYVGGVGSEIYITGTWSDPLKKIDEDSGPCSAKILSLGEGEAFDINCSCKITGNGPLRFSSTCFLDFSVPTPGDSTADISAAFQCTAFTGCAGSYSYFVSSSASTCVDGSGTPCKGFRIVK
ncbi:hypothetical protein COCC4DRAFT_27642 [Bipolaris maydis ATCC 48331]|uniref:Uncharacterized protein n=2 Tax=Cochliobolus heterostrophus TaxID=5016 RepID=M2TL33_COCH5|nr:uncharacterized protein COCC4DRAFT_27642 [Bipolaris maydis ATCC 48331]EMD87199.1 hypothetical protein COCHEDRAFT_1217406 [Bipolaris maydis C5]KAJ5022959.1 hypothetical protein J3E73DRAFT_336063 [Bipolaris maydis]ENI00406.1 hypothetical protein COCC4DRAFT_27642 [Bipolaris maydis ATCC 48331]KAJ6211822.1 hypothetical protein PSV09DRAFT_1217406 [Bipolaris maydis]KAJ6267247.1 hypothetical protein PSV08DRAFT_15487 [Bipolaris maydis]